MKTFIIDSENHISVHDPQTAGQLSVPEGTCTFSSADEFEALARVWPGARLVAIWNGLPRAAPIKKFTDRGTAVRRLWHALQELEVAAVEPVRSEAALRNTKTSCVLELLRRTEGATVKELMAATNWRSHSVRGFLSGTIRKRMGLVVVWEHRANGDRAYRLVDRPPQGEPR